MEISLTLGDVVVHTVIGLGVTFIVFLLSILYRRAVPWLSDYWARRSVSAASKQISRLEKALAEYETDFADPRRFVGRIILKATAAIALLIATTLLTVIAIGYYVVAHVHCEINRSCAEYYGEFFLYDLNSRELRASVLILVIALLVEFLFFITLSALTLEASPEKYRARLGERIARLRRRMGSDNAGC
jgi:multisubunit Na+/H+ antiporter MnhB subunit